MSNMHYFSSYNYFPSKVIGLLKFNKKVLKFGSV